MPIVMALFKSTAFMTALAAVIILMAVVLPITGAMGQLSQTPVESNNTIEEGDYMMAFTKSLKTSEKIVVSDTADGITLKIGSGAAVAVTSSRVIIADTCLVTISANNTVTVYEQNGTFSQLITTADGDSITFSGSKWTIKHTPSGEAQQTITGRFDWIYYPSETGEYLHANAPIFVDKDSEILAGGATYSSSGRSVIRGTLNDLEVVYSYYSNASNPAATYTQTGYTNQLESISLLAGGTTVTITDFIVPLEYTSDMESSMTSTLVFLIPLILAAALILMICYNFIIERREA